MGEWAAGATSARTSYRNLPLPYSPVWYGVNCGRSGRARYVKLQRDPKLRATNFRFDAQRNSTDQNYSNLKSRQVTGTALNDKAIS